MEGAFGKMGDQLGNISSSCSHLVKIEHLISIEGTMRAIEKKRDFIVNASLNFSNFRLICCFKYRMPKEGVRKEFCM